MHNFLRRRYRLICFFLFLAIILRPAGLIYQQKGKFFYGGYSAQYDTLQKAYYSSQYVKKENPGIIPDETFEAFVGGAFLAGTNPIHIVHEHPPLGRYIIALSIILFDNASTIIIPLTILSMVGIFLISKLVLKDTLFSLIPLVIFANEPLFLSKFTFTPLLEPIQLPFIVFSVYFFIMGIKGKLYLKWFILCSLMLGFVISVRFFILGATEVFSFILYFLFNRNLLKKMIVFLFTLPLSIIVLLFSYTKTITDGYSITQIFGVQKYIFFYHQSKFINPLSFWDLILFNRWHTWWGDRSIITDSNWTIFWPISTILTFIFAVLGVLKKIKINEPEKIILLWIVSYISLLSIGTTTTRYFLPLLPFIYILAVDFLFKKFKFIK